MTPPATRPGMVDSRQPRLGQAIIGLSLLVAFVLDAVPVIPMVGLLLGAAAVLGPRFNPYAALFRGLRRAGAFGPPRELEEAAPPRFANAVGFVFLAVASLAAFLGVSSLAWGLALVVSGLALLSAATGLCVGCQLYVIGRRVLTGGRSPGRIMREDLGAAG
jgi:Domain of unknown function (DUF4395)